MSDNLDLAQRTDEELAAAAKREGSDGPAFGELLSRYRQRVWQTCFRLMSDQEDAADAAQEVFVRLFLARAKFEGRSKYSTWVHGVAIRTCLAMRRARGRRRKREVLAEDVLPAESGGSEPVSPGLKMDLMKMLEILSEEDRAMMILKYAEGHSYDELAEMFDLSVSACKMRLSRAREKIKKEFPEHVRD